MRFPCIEAIAGIVCLASCESSNDSPTKEWSDEPLIERDYSPYVARAQSMLHALGVEVSDLNYQFSSSWDMRTESERIRIKWENEALFRFYNASGTAFSYLNSRSTPSFTKSPQSTPKWTSAKAATEAENYLRILGEKGKFSLGDPITRWKAQSDPEGRSFVEESYWTIQWNRHTSDGIPFRDDFYLMQITEDSGLYFFQSKMMTNYPDASGSENPIPEEQAVELARKRAHRTTENSALSMFIPSRKMSMDPAPIIDGLSVVRPNYFDTVSDVHHITESLNGRLAWVMMFQFWHGGHYEELKARGIGPRVGVIVWIDALNGEYLGGDLSPYPLPFNEG